MISFNTKHVCFDHKINNNLCLIHYCNEYSISHKL